MNRLNKKNKALAIQVFSNAIAINSIKLQMGGYNDKTNNFLQVQNQRFKKALKELHK